VVAASSPTAPEVTDSAALDSLVGQGACLATHKGGIDMQRLWNRLFAGVIGLIGLTFAAVHLMSQAYSQTGEGWVTLLDDKDMGDWNRVGETNWRLEDGAVVADSRTSEILPFWSVKSRTGTSSCTSSSGPATTPTAASSFAALIPRASPTAPATR
jgi:hypothetical protein